MGDKLFTFTRFPKSQWKSIHTSNAIERLHEEFKRRIKTQTVLPSAETAANKFCRDGSQKHFDAPERIAHIHVGGLDDRLYLYLFATV